MKHRATGWGQRGLKVKEAPGSQPDSCPESSCTPFMCQHPSGQCSPSPPPPLCPGLGSLGSPAVLLHLLCD